MKDKVRILLADKYPIFITGLESLLILEDDFEIIGKATNGSDVLKIIEARSVDIAVMSISMSVLNGLDTAEIIKSINPSIKIVFITMYNNDDYIRRAQEIGVEGYILREEEPHIIIESIRAICNGYFKYKVDHHDLNLKIPIKIANLTLRESQIFQLKVEGKTNNEIAKELQISVKTVQCHNYSVKKKMNITNAMDMFRIACQYKLVDVNTFSLLEKA